MPTITMITDVTAATMSRISGAYGLIRDACDRG